MSPDKGPESIFKDNKVIVGMVDRYGNFQVCVDRGVHGVVMYPVTSDDKDGYWCLNLWYSSMLIGDNIEIEQGGADV